MLFAMTIFLCVIVVKVSGFFLLLFNCLWIFRIKWMKGNVMSSIILFHIIGFLFYFIRSLYFFSFPPIFWYYLTSYYGLSLTSCNLNVTSYRIINILILDKWKWLADGFMCFTDHLILKQLKLLKTTTNPLLCYCLNQPFINLSLVIQ